MTPTKPTTARRRKAPYPHRRPTRRNTRPEHETTRRYLGLAIVALIATVAIIGVWVPAALPILEKLMPLLGLLCGFYFGQLQA